MPRKPLLKETRAKYATKKKKIAVSIDPERLARAPIILKQNGETIGAVISLKTYRAFKTWERERKPAKDFPPEWYADKAAFQEMLPNLLKTHREKFVAIYQGKMIDSDEKEGELIWRMQEKYRDTPVYVDEVLEKPRVYRMPMIRLVRD